MQPYGLESNEKSMNMWMISLKIVTYCRNQHFVYRQPKGYIGLSFMLIVCYHSVMLYIYCIYDFVKPVE